MTMRSKITACDITWTPQTRFGTFQFALEGQPRPPVVPVSDGEAFTAMLALLRAASVEQPLWYVTLPDGTFRIETGWRAPGGGGAGGGVA
jgi:hypothetical protein